MNRLIRDDAARRYSPNGVEPRLAAYRRRASDITSSKCQSQKSTTSTQRRRVRTGSRFHSETVYRPFVGSEPDFPAADRRIRPVVVIADGIGQRDAERAPLC
jgi:hypothetical protein